MHNFKLQKLVIKNLLMALLLIFNFLKSMIDIRRRYNPIVNLSKFTSNKKILSKVGYNQFCGLTLS